MSISQQYQWDGGGKMVFFRHRDEIVKMGRKFDVMSEKCFHGEWNVEWWPKF